MRSLFTSILLATALVTPVALAQQSPSAKPGQSSSGQTSGSQSSGSQSSGQAAAKAPTRVEVTPANEITGQTVYNRQGDEVGEVEYLLIDPRTGKVQYALIGSGGLFDIGEKMTPVPWTSLTVTPGDEDSTVTLNADLATLRQGQSFSREDLQNLTEPVLVTQVNELYASQPQSAGSTNAQQAQKGAGSSGATNQNSTAGQSSAGQSNTSQGQQTQNQPQGQNRTSNQASGSASNPPMVLVGEEFVTILAPPLLISPSEIRGSTVQTTTGQDVGDLDRIMIDVRRGQVAYVLIEHGGFLGFGEKWLPVPLQALSWSPADEGFVLNANEQQLKQMPGLPKQDLPAQLRIGDLKKLYDQFGVRPYWT